MSASAAARSGSQKPPIHSMLMLRALASRRRWRSVIVAFAVGFCVEQKVHVRKTKSRIARTETVTVLFVRIRVRACCRKPLLQRRAPCTQRRGPRGSYTAPIGAPIGITHPRAPYRAPYRAPIGPLYTSLAFGSMPEPKQSPRRGRSRTPPDPRCTKWARILRRSAPYILLSGSFVLYPCCNAG